MSRKSFKKMQKTLDFIESNYYFIDIRLGAEEYGMTQRNNNEVLKAMFLKEGIEFPNDDGWNSLAEHVEVHNQYLTMKLGFNVTWKDAVFSWYENIYTPLYRAIMKRSVLRALPSMTTGEIYLAVSDHWFYLKERDEDISAEIAAYDFVYRNRERKNLIKKMFNFHGSDNMPKGRLSAA
ncbi:MAG: hypothetical protein PQJ61_07105 [Spirochaetales bacterium]|uniref:Uncharacterized protein n=1 Tax=Candidatus Thalassospirochaeta sargassi TaxID=3119039 RepID=A0AAJ1MK72_9SPIO|nr:hypothetical protein [Spirochaetales bacterium]